MSKQRRLDLVFMFVIPTALALTMALAGGYVQRLGFLGAAVYLGLLSMLPWWVAAGCSFLFWRILRRHRPPLWAVGGVGAVLAAFLVIYPISELNSWFRAEWIGGDRLVNLSWHSSSERLGQIALSVGRPAVLWIAFLYVFSTSMGWNRYAFGEPHSDSVDRQRFSNSGSGWTTTADAELARYVSGGLKSKEISKLMNRTIPAIRTRTSKLQLKKSPMK